MAIMLKEKKYNRQSKKDAWRKTFKKTFLSGYRRKKSIEEAMHDENYHITKNSPILTIKCIVQGKNKNIKTS